jgi:integrase
VGEQALTKALGDRTVASLTAEDLKTWRDKLARQSARKRTRKGKKQEHKADQDEMTDEERDEAKRARRATANRILAVLKAILNKAFEDKKVKDDSEWRRVKPFPKVDVPRIRFLTEPEAIRLVNGCTPEFRPLFRAALLTGARYGELVRMAVGNFDPTTAQVFIAPSKSGRPRHIPLNAAGVELFKTLTTGRSPSAPMFVRADGEQWGKNHQQRPLLEACKRAKTVPPLRFHEARHSYASALARAGADLLIISKLLGHADTRITSRHYAHLCDKTLANAVNNLLPAFGAAEQSNVAAIR